jgi:hypothetical protein
MYLRVTFDRRMTWRRHIERTVVKALRTYIRIYYLHKSGRLRTNTKFTSYKALITSVVTYTAPPGSKYMADAHLLKL